MIFGDTKLWCVLKNKTFLILRMVDVHWRKKLGNVKVQKKRIKKVSPVIFYLEMTAAAKSLQSCPTLCDPIDGSPPGPPIPGILQARTLEWVAISFSNAWKWKVKVKLLSRDRLLATPWTAAYQAPPSMGFSRQEYWSGVPLPSPYNSYPTTDLRSPWRSESSSCVFVDFFNF